MTPIQQRPGPLNEHERRRFREAMVERIRAGKPNPFEPSSPAHAAYAFTRELVGHAERAPQSALGQHSRAVVGTAASKASQGTNAIAGTNGSSEDMPPVPGGKPPQRVGQVDPVSGVFADTIFSKESAGSGGYRAVNPSPQAEYTAYGRYQLQRAALVSVGLQTRDGKWTGAMGIHSEEDFLNSPHVQDIAFSGYMRVLRGELRNRGSLRWIGDTATTQDGSSVVITESGLVAAAHREGSYAVEAYLDFLEAHDGSAAGQKFPETKIGDTDRTLAQAFQQIEERLALFAAVPYRAGGKGGRALVVPPRGKP